MIILFFAEQKLLLRISLVCIFINTKITSEWINSFKDIISSTPFVFTTLGEIANNYESATSESATSTSDVWTYN